MRSLGICLGASTISAVELLKDESGNVKIEKIISRSHEGNAKQTFIDILAEIKPETFDRIAVTGRKFRENVNLTQVTEPEAIEYSLEFLNLNNAEYNVLVSAGGESVLVYELDPDHKITQVHMGNKCASGTGEFFLQQIRRMDLSVDEAIKAAKGQHAHKIAGRCSVFCKSDCTHALNIGEPKGAVVAGLCKMISGKICELLSTIEPKNVIITGGISKNSVVVDYLKKEVNKLLVPEQAYYFEALGAALYAFTTETRPFIGLQSVYSTGASSFEFLKKLSDYEQLVTFKKAPHGEAGDGMKCVLGIDVGSTTTKAVLINMEDDKIIADTYLRTNGNPVEAARNCYKEIKKQIGNKKISIEGLATTGSGRQIVGLHAFTECVINEIICHATASVYFDKEVDTIYEIGGQDAKYTYLVDGVPADYAMNEACSAGTGSFLEESALESLGIKMEDIAGIALKAHNPPNFNDQCAAFISSDIKVASQEGIDREDIVAGLVYSICMNYANRVRGSRKTGDKVFMQGGVCYNKAVPIAMAALTGKQIIVPPDPGLMGAFGAALEAKKRLTHGLLEKTEVNLDVLIERDVSYAKTFKCAGGAEKCDRGCEIMTIVIDGKTYPFGGACNKYYNQIHKVKFDEDKLDLVALRERMIFEKYAPKTELPEDAKVIGINRSFYTNTYFPLYYNFFTKLGFKVVYSDSSESEGEEKVLAPFCYPMILAHGFFNNLLKKNPDYVFMPHLVQLETEGSCCELNEQIGYRKSCVFNQGEPYTLKTAFRDELKDKNIKMLVPIFDFSRGIDKDQEAVITFAVKEFGLSRADVKKAFQEALKIQRDFFKETKELGRKALKDLENNPDKIAVVLFGRPYNAFTEKANMSIPRKFTSRGVEIIPYDFLDFEDEEFEAFMHWAMGETVLKGAQVIKKHPQLFSTFITNFSCGPDSFLVELFRDEMEGKPSLTLELDSHSADAGVNTRIEAFLDVVNFYRSLLKNNKIKLPADIKKDEEEEESDDGFVPARIIGDGFKAKIHLSDNKTVIKAKSSDYTFLFPSLSHYVMGPANEYLNKIGVRGRLSPQTTLESIKLGRSQTSSKECLPMAMMLGNLMTYIKEERKPDETIVLLHATDTSPCRLEQYYNAFNSYVKRNKVKDFAIFRLDDRKGYAGFGTGLLLTLFKSFVLGDVFETIKHGMMVLAEDKESALKIFEEEFTKIMDNFGGRDNVSMFKRFELAAKRFAAIPRKGNIEDAKFITLTGEVYVRNDRFARRNIEGYLADRGFITQIVPFMEVLFYIDYCMQNDLTEINVNLFMKIYFFFKSFFQGQIDKKIKNIFAESGFYKRF
jgi:predicted CoA-substrate-specific enzyme activase